jgi:hypothetical protein
VDGLTTLLVRGSGPQRILFHVIGSAQLRACLGELQLCKNNSRAADPRNFTVEQLHCGSVIPKSVWYNSRFAIITMTYRAHMSSENEKQIPFSSTERMRPVA